MGEVRTDGPSHTLQCMIKSGKCKTTTTETPRACQANYSPVGLSGPSHSPEAFCFSGTSSSWVFFSLCFLVQTTHGCLLMQFCLLIQVGNISFSNSRLIWHNIYILGYFWKTTVVHYEHIPLEFWNCVQVNQRLQSLCFYFFGALWLWAQVKIQLTSDTCTFQERTLY